MRLGVESALVDGHVGPGDVEITGGRVAGVGLASPNGRGIAVPGSRPNKVTPSFGSRTPAT